MVGNLLGFFFVTVAALGAFGWGVLIYCALKPDDDDLARRQEEPPVVVKMRMGG